MTLHVRSIFQVCGWLGAILLLPVVSPTVTGQTSGDALRVTVVQSADTVAAGDGVSAYLTVEGAATGPVSVLIDGLGILQDGFVRKLHEDTSVCAPGAGCAPCPQGRRCFGDSSIGFATDVRTTNGRRTVPITVTDSRGRTARASLTLTVLPAHDDDADGMPDAWEFFYFGYSRNEPGFGADRDPDGDGISNVEEFRRGTNPRARVTRYFAEASSGDRPPAHLHTVDVAGTTEGVAVFTTFIGDDGRRASFNLSNNSPYDWVLPAGSVGGHWHPADRVVAVIVETSGPAIVQRRLEVEYPLHATALRSTGLPMAAPATRWHFADGGTDGTLDTFFLTYNPGSGPVEATITYRTDKGTVARQSTRTIMPGSRTTIWTNVDDAPLGRVGASAEITATAPILVERAWRFDPPGRTVTHAYASPGSDDASSRWIFPRSTAPLRSRPRSSSPTRRRARPWSTSRISTPTASRSGADSCVSRRAGGPRSRHARSSALPARVPRSSSSRPTVSASSPIARSAAATPPARGGTRRSVPVRRPRGGRSPTAPGPNWS